MDVIEATFHNGQIVLDAMPDWPEGCRLRIEPLPATPQVQPVDVDAPETPEQIAEWIGWFRSLEPLEFTAEEEAALAAWRQKRKELAVVKTQRRIEELFQ